jgi:hypothetical protein
MKELEQNDIGALLELYMNESKEFSKALESGVTWKILQEKRGRVSEVGELISRKYDEMYGQVRK